MSVVGIRELKSGLSKYLKRVAAGERITVTERGHPVAVLIPVDRPLSAPLQAMIAAGTARWPGGNRVDLHDRRDYGRGRRSRRRSVRIGVDPLSRYQRTGKDVRR